jgi:hypothetical protein
MTPSRFRWGMLLILFGLLLLLRNLEYINNNFWSDFLVYLPVLLIAIGIEKIFTKTKLQFISYATSVVLLAGGLALAFTGSTGGSQDSFFEESSYRHEADPQVKSLHAILNLGNSNLTVRDASDDLISGQFKQFSQKPDIAYSVEGESANVTFTGKGKEFLWGLVKVNGGDPNEWYLSFSNIIPLTLECNGHNSDIHLNLATTPTRSVRVSADEATIYLKMGTQEPVVTVDLEGKDSDIRLRIPSGAGLKVTGTNDDQYLSQVGLTQRGNAFVSEDYDNTSSHIEVKLDDRLSSLSIDYY